MDEFELFDLIRRYGELKITRKKLFSEITAYDYMNNKVRTLIKAMEEYRHKKIAKRDLQVSYFCGASGSGKTLAAKYFAEKLGYDYFISGSGDDILDGYDKEECIILDDYRAGTLKFAEFLKMTDNNTNSSVKSRYNNKDISNCKLIMITSIKTPSELYPMLSEENMDEPKEQFYRRLKHRYYSVEPDRHIVERFLYKDKMHEATGNTLGSVNDIFKELGIDPKAVDDNSILSKFHKTDDILRPEDFDNAITDFDIFDNFKNMK